MRGLATPPWASTVHYIKSPWVYVAIGLMMAGMLYERATHTCHHQTYLVWFSSTMPEFPQSGCWLGSDSAYCCVLVYTAKWVLLLLASKSYPIMCLCWGNRIPNSSLLLCQQWRFGCSLGDNYYNRWAICPSVVMSIYMVNFIAKWTTRCSMNNKAFSLWVELLTNYWLNSIIII